jgi:hypothetical protein
LNEATKHFPEQISEKLQSMLVKEGAA